MAYVVPLPIRFPSTQPKKVNIMKRKQLRNAATENRLSAFFTADDIKREVALADALAYGVHHGRYTTLTEGVEYIKNVSLRSKSRVPAVTVAIWNALVEEAYTSPLAYTDEAVARLLCVAAKEAGCRKDTLDATADATRTWLKAKYDAERSRRAAVKAKALEEALRLAEAAAATTVKPESQGEVAPRRKAADAESTLTATYKALRAAETREWKIIAPMAMYDAHVHARKAHIEAVRASLPDDTGVVRHWTQVYTAPTSVNADVVDVEWEEVADVVETLALPAPIEPAPTTKTPVTKKPAAKKRATKKAAVAA